MSNAKQTYHPIEYYISELIKREEIIEKLFEEVDDLKDNQQEQSEFLKVKIQENEDIWKSREKDIKDELKELKIQNQELEIENQKLLKQDLIDIPMNKELFFTLFLFLSLIRTSYSFILIFIFILLFLKEDLNTEKIIIKIENNQLHQLSYVSKLSD